MQRVPVSGRIGGRSDGEPQRAFRKVFPTCYASVNSLLLSLFTQSGTPDLSDLPVVWPAGRIRRQFLVSQSKEADEEASWSRLEGCSKRLGLCNVAAASALLFDTRKGYRRCSFMIMLPAILQPPNGEGDNCQPDAFKDLGHRGQRDRHRLQAYSPFRAWTHTPFCR